MKTVKQLATLFLIFFVTNGYSQYLETFSIPNKGVLSGSCSGSEASCNTDYVGVDWRITGDFSGMDSNDFFSTDGSGRLNGDGDADALNAPGLCFETPVLDISAVAGPSSFTLNLDWVSWDVADICNVEYQLDGGAWVQVPPLPGTSGPGTVQFNTDSNSGSGTPAVAGLNGNTLSIRVCLLNTNSFFDDIFIDNVSVPEAGSVVLPVKWADFSVRSLSRGNQLNWTTYSEVNNERFDVEKSVGDIFNFEKIGSVDGVGNSSKKNDYEFLDSDLSSTTSYYRLKQVDFDGNYEYSEVVVVKNRSVSQISFSPNPFGDQILMSSNQVELEEGNTIRMYNTQGQIVLNKIITKQNLEEPIDTGALNAGMYFIQYGDGEVIRLAKF